MTFQVRGSSKRHFHDIVKGLVEGRNPPLNAFEGMQWKATGVSWLRLSLLHLFGMTGSRNWKVNESWWNTWYTLVSWCLTQTFHGQAVESVHFRCSYTTGSGYEITRSPAPLPNSVEDWKFFDLWTKYKRFNRLYHKYYKKSNINVYILISFTRQFLISLNPHTLVLFISVKKSREEKINKSTDFLIGFFL